MKRLALALSFLILFAGCSAKDKRALTTEEVDYSEQKELLLDSLFTLDELNQETSRKRIPPELFSRAQGIALFPVVVKGSLLGGYRSGKGVVTVRSPSTGKWGPPLFVEMSKGSFGFQAGIDMRDVVFLVVTNRGFKHLFQSKYELDETLYGGAGPTGRNVQAQSEKLRGDFLGYSTTRGAFKKDFWKGAVLKKDKDANKNFYGKSFSTKTILLGHKNLNIPEIGQKFMERVNDISPPGK